MRAISASCSGVCAREANRGSAAVSPASPRGCDSCGASTRGPLGGVTSRGSSTQASKARPFKKGLMCFGEWSPLCSDSDGVMSMWRSAGGDEDAVDNSTESVEYFFLGVVANDDGNGEETSLPARMPNPSVLPPFGWSSETQALGGALESPLSDGGGFFFFRTEDAILMRRSSAVDMEEESVCDFDPKLRDISDG